MIKKKKERRQKSTSKPKPQSSFKPPSFSLLFFPTSKATQQLGRENPSYWLLSPVATTLSSKYKRRKLRSEGNGDGRTQSDGDSVRCLVSSFLMKNFVQTGPGLSRKQPHGKQRRMSLCRPEKKRELFIALWIYIWGGKKSARQIYQQHFDIGMHCQVAASLMLTRKRTRGK